MSEPSRQLRLTLGPAPGERLDKALAAVAPEGLGLSRSRLQSLIIEGAVTAAMAFYESIGKRPIRLRRELVGHVANRLQAALWREAFHLVGTGAATVADIDAAIAHGPGLRWALMGPCLLNHLSGGPKGLAHTLDHLGPLMEAMWADLGDPRLTPELKQTLVQGLEQALEGRDRDAMVAQRDRLLVDLVRQKRAAPDLP